MIALDLKGVAVSGGSACHSGATEPSHVLMAMGLDKTRARASLRFSLLKTATEADVDHVLQVVPEAVEHLRAVSPVAAGTAGMKGTAGCVVALKGHGFSRAARPRGNVGL